jgi:adenylate kinase family enzyme
VIGQVGNYVIVNPTQLGNSVIADNLAASDRVVWIDLPRLLVTYRVLRRTVYRCATRQELWNGNRNRWRDIFSTDPMTSTVAAAWTRYPAQRARLVAATTDPQWARSTFVHLRSQRQVRQYVQTLSQHQDREPG